MLPLSAWGLAPALPSASPGSWGGLGWAGTPGGWWGPGVGDHSCTGAVAGRGVFPCNWLPQRGAESLPLAVPMRGLYLSLVQGELLF